MKLKNIFKMEIYKNCKDTVYLWVIFILAAMALVTTIWVCLAINNGQLWNNSLLDFMAIFTIMGVSVFPLLYTFHLLNVDYRNKVMSLIIASGVSREKYYFVKIGTTILCSLVAVFIILLIPIIIISIVYRGDFMEVIYNFFHVFDSVNTFLFILILVMELIASTVMLTTAVIIAKGKTVGIFLYFAINFIVSMIRTMCGMSFIDPNHLYFEFIVSIVEIIVFALIGLQVLRTQNL